MECVYIYTYCFFNNLKYEGSLASAFNPMGFMFWNFLYLFSKARCLALNVEGGAGFNRTFWTNCIQIGGLVCCAREK